MFEALRNGWKNIAERSVATFVQVVLAGVLVVPAEEWTADLWRSAAVAGVAAVLSVFKNVAVEYSAVREESPVSKDF